MMRKRSYSTYNVGPQYMTEQSWAIRLYKNGDESGYVALMKSVFPRYKCDLRHWRWEFVDNPLGSIQVVGDFNDKIVGHMGLIGVPMKIGERTVRGSQLVDLAVHPNLRGRGMFFEIGKKLMQEAEKKGMIISYGVPDNPRGHMKYGCFLVSEIPVLVRTMNKKGLLLLILAQLYSFTGRTYFKSLSNSMILFKNLLRITNIGYRKQAQCFESLEISIVNAFSKGFDELWETASQEYRLLVARNAEYLDWRYKRKPHFNYIIASVESNHRIEGYIVLSTGVVYGFTRKKYGYIVDIFAESEKAVLYLLQFAIDYFAKQTVDLVACWMMKNTMYYQCLQELRFINDISSTQKLICRLNSADSKFRKLYHEVRKEWFFTIGDSDRV